MTDVTALEAQDAHMEYRRFLTHRRDAERSFLMMGQDILDFQNNETWRKLGHDSLNAFLAAPIESGGCSISTRRGLVLADVVKRYVQELGCSEEKLLSVGHTKLELLLPHVDRGNVRDRLDEADMDSWRGLREKYRGADEFVPKEPSNASFRAWVFDKAPPEMKNLFKDPHEWLAVVPGSYMDSAAVQIDTDGSFMVGEVSFHAKDMVLLPDHSRIYGGNTTLFSGE